MSVIKRTGSYGDYYGSTVDQSSPCDTNQMKVNATYIYKYLSSKGWTIQSVAALLGNMQAESSINPGRWQSDIPGALTMGYSLVQWTPATKYTEWARDNGFNDYSEMDSALARIIYEVENNIQWIGAGTYSGMSFEDFTKSERTVSDLAVAFLLCYERPADQSLNVQLYRSSLANTWYGYLGGIPGTDVLGKKKKYNFILFNKRRRKRHG